MTTRHPRRRLLRWMAVFLAVVVGLGAGAWLFRKPLFGGLIARAVEAALAAELGGTWEVGAVDGSLLRDVVLEDVRLVAPEAGQAIRHAVIPRAEAAYDVRGLLRGEGVGAVRRIGVRGADIHLDLDRDSGTTTEGLPDLTFEPLETVLPPIEVEGALRVRLLGRRLDVGVVRITTDGPEAIDVALREVRVEGERIEGSAEGRILRPDDQRIQWTSATSLAGVSVPTATWFLDGRLVGRLVTPGGAISFTADADAIEADASALDLARMPAWVRAFAPEDPGWPTRGRVAGRVRLEDRKGPVARVTATVEDLAWPKQTIDRARLELASDSAGRIRIDRLDVRAAEGSASVVSAVLDPAFPYLLRDAQHIAVDVPDLGALVPEVDDAVALHVEAGSEEDGTFTIRKAHAVSPHGTLDATGRLVLTDEPERWADSRFELQVEGQLERLDSIVEGLDGGATLAGDVQGTLARLDIDLVLEGQDARWERLEIQGGRARGVLEDLKTLSLKEARVRTPVGHVDGTANIVLAPFRLDAVVDAVAEDLEKSLRVLDLEVDGLAGAAAAQATIRVIDDAWRIVGHVKGRDLQMDGEALGRVDVGFALDPRRLEVQEAEAEGAWGSAVLAGGWALDGDSIDVASLALHFDDEAIRLAGPATFRIDGSIVESGPLVIEGLGGRLETQAEANLDRMQLRLGQTIFTRDEQRIQAEPGLRLAWANDTLTVADLRVHADGHDLELRRPATVRFEAERVVAEGLEVLTHDTVIRGHVAFGERLDADLKVDDVPLSRLHPDAPGRAWAHLVLRGDEATLHARVSELAWAGRKGDLRVTARQGPEGGIEIATVKLAGDIALEGRGALPYRIGPDGLEALPRELARLHLEGVVAGLPESAIEIDPVRVTLDGEGDTLRARLSNRDGEALVTLTPSGAEATARLDHDDVARVRGSATLDRGFAWSAPEGIETLADAHVSARGDATLTDWASLRALVPLVASLKGEASGLLRVEGPLRQPSIEGFVELKGVEAELEEDLPALTALDARFVWRDGDVVIESCRGEVGYAPFEVRGRVERVLQPDRAIDIGLKGKYLLLARDASMRLRSDLDLKLEGTLDALRLGGEAVIRDLLYVAPVAMDGDAEAGATGGVGGFVLLSLEDEPLKSMKLDLRVRADDTIRIRNNLVRGNAGIDLRIGGTGFRPEPEGTIVSRGASVYLPANSLQVDAAEILFRSGDPFRPLLRATARTRASGYFLGVRASGLLPDVNVSVFSRPRLSDENAMLLLATGAMAEGGGGAAGVEALTLQKAFEFFGDNLLSFARGTASPEARPFFDRFTLTVGRRRTRSGRDTVEGDAAIAERVHLYGERDVWDETNLGFIWRLRFR